MLARKLVLVILALMLGLSVAWVGCAPAAPGSKAADFYKGNTIDFTVNDNAGSVTDLLGRTIAPYLQKATGANVVVSNRRGASGTEGVIWVNQAKPDGLTLGMWLYPSMILNKLYENPGAGYDPATLVYLLKVGEERTLWSTAVRGSYKSIADLKASKNLIVPGTSLRGGIGLNSMAGAYLAGLDFKLVVGYAGSDKVILAVEQGEAAGIGMSVLASMPYIVGGRLKPMFTISPERDPVVPDVPAITELVTLTAERKALLDVIGKWLQGMILFTNPGAPQDRVQYLRDTLQNISTMPDFRNDVAKVIGFKVERYTNGKDLQKLMEEMTKKVAETKPMIDKLYEQYAAVKK